MKQTDSKHKPILPKILCIVCTVLLVGVLCYGIALLSLGLWEHHTLQTARKQYTAVPVCVTAVSPADAHAAWNIITLEPIDAKAKEKLGATCTTVFQSDLQAGSILTMYYDSNDLQNRIVDFHTADDLLLRGGLFTAIPAIAGIIYLLGRRRKKKQKPPTVIIRPEDTV